MRITVFILLFASLLTVDSRGEDLIPGHLSFDLPPYMNGGPPGRSDPGDDPFSPVREIRRYAVTRTNWDAGFNNMFVSLRDVGYSIGNGKVITYRKLDDKALRTCMQETTTKQGHGTNFTQVANAKVGGLAALVVAYDVPQPPYGSRPATVARIESYWVKVQANRVLEIKLWAQDPKTLAALRSSLDRFKITP
ncbi:MAG TPA: hypothetical protein VMB21_19775 [Candidatus Limnocylindria bacterium]|jgi:hypothetical protein|nr:hypothetical protein [Candidatus Limnocylindria bacterium]